MSQNSSTTPDPQEGSLRNEPDVHGQEFNQDSAPPARSDVEGQPAAPTRKPLEYYDDPRDAIEDSIDQRRLAENAQNFKDWSDPKTRWGQDTVLANRDDASDYATPLARDGEPPPEPAPFQVQPQTPSPAPQPGSNVRRRADGSEEYRLVVDGRELYQTLDEMRGAAQKGLHADSELNETKRLQRELQASIDEARRLSEQLRSGAVQPARAEPSPENPGAPGASSSPTPAAVDASEAELAEKVQYGTKEESAAALKAMIARAQPKQEGLTPELLRDTIRQAAREDRYEEDARQAMQAFMDSIPGLQQDRYRSNTVLLAAHDVMRDDMAQLVAKDQNWPVEQAAELVGRMTPEQVEKTYKAFHLKGYSVRTPHQIIQTVQAKLPWLTPAQPGPSPVGNGAASQFAVPRDQRTQGLPIQPAQRNQPTQQQPQQNRPQSNAEIIAEERIARGLPH